MTKLEAREIMSAELISCISEAYGRLPAHIKVDIKDRKTFISLKGYKIYVCFSVSDSLYYAIYREGALEKDERLIHFRLGRETEDLRAMVRDAFQASLQENFPIASA